IRCSRESEELFQRAASAVVVGRSERRTDVTQVPGFRHIPRGARHSSFVADDEAVLPRMLSNPSRLAGATESADLATAAATRDDIHRESGLVFTEARTCRDLICTLLPARAHMSGM